MPTIDPADRNDINSRSLVVELAASHDDILASQRLRYQVFAGEMGAQLESDAEQIDRDLYDPYCQHLVVRDTETRAIIASTRILTDDNARQIGSFYSESEFELSGLMPLPGRVMEIGRTCVNAQYRNGGAISVLWSGLAQFMNIHRFDYLMGCASVGLGDGGAQISAIMRNLRAEHLSPESRRVRPRLNVPDAVATAVKPALPPLLKAYLRLGARVCGEPCWDRDFNVADVFVLLDLDDLSPRYQRHFLQRAAQPMRAQPHTGDVAMGL